MRDVDFRGNMNKFAFVLAIAGFIRPTFAHAATALTNVDNNWSATQTFQDSITVQSAIGSVISVGGNTVGLSVTQNDTTNNPAAAVITSTGSGNALKIVGNGNYGLNSQTSGALVADCTKGTGYCAQFYTNAGAQSAGPLGVVNIVANNAAWNEPTLYLLAPTTNFPASTLRIDAGIPTVTLVDTSVVAPAGKFQFTDHLDHWRFEGRNSANNAFDSSFQVFRPTAQPNVLIGNGYQSPHNAQFEIFANNFLKPTDFVVAVDSQDFLAGDLFSILSNGSVGIQRSVPFTSSVFEVGPNQAAFSITTSGHVRLRGSNPAVACNVGTATLASYSMDHAGRFTMSVAAPSVCTVTFHSSFDQPPSCWCMDETTLTACQTQPTTTAVVINAAVTFGATDVISYGCQDAW